MFRNYFKILLRFMVKQKGFSLINISGLTIGIACSLLILLYIQNELGYDRFHKDAERTYRVAFEGVIQGLETRSAQTGFPLARAIRKTEGVAEVMRMASWKTFPVSYEGKGFTEDHLLLADANFFRFFSFRLIEGHPDSVLSETRQVVITESAAKRYFDYQGKGDTGPIGKTLIFAQGYKATVSGIAEDPPPNSHVHYTLLLSLKSWESEYKAKDDWITGRVYTYFKLLPETKPESTQATILSQLHTQLNYQLTTLRSTDLEAFKKQGNDLRYIVQPLTDIHLRSALRDEIENNGSLENIIMFGCIALFITLLACINFMNLTTAQSANRAKEIAVRKSVGASHDRLIIQFLLESYFYVVVAVLFALTIIFISIEPFNYFTGKSLSVQWLLRPEFVAGIIVFILVTGLVAGSYPSFYLTRFSPVEVLKGNLRARMRSFGIRNVLVVFQFFISSALIIATLIVYNQLQFIQNLDLGFDKSKLINLLHTRNLGDNGVEFKKALQQNPDIVSASYCNRLPPNIDWQSVFRPADQDKDYLLAIYEVDQDHLETMGYKMAAGRFFRTDYPADTFAVILNESAAGKLGIKDFSKKTLFTDYDQPSGRVRQIIGIIRDFNFHSVKEPIQPMAIVLGSQPNWEMAVRTRGAKADSTIAFIRNQWRKYAPDAAFEYSLVEENFDSKQGAEKRIGFLFLIFTILAIVIACLGLFGLATFTAEHHRKQIGIRKVLGASLRNIMMILNKEFLKLVLIANLLAWPFTWWIMQKWLNQFAYNAGIAWWIFILAGATTFLIALVSMSFKTYRAATINPVDSLRSE